MIGGGQMALALAAGFHSAGLLDPAGITVYDPHPPARERLAERLPGIVFADSAAEAAAAADVVFLAVKPQQAAAACREIAGRLRDEAVLVSIVAGLSTTTLAALVGTRRIIRVMPNTPCLVGRGVSVVCGTPEVPAAVRAPEPAAAAAPVEPPPPVEEAAPAPPPVVKNADLSITVGFADGTFKIGRIGLDAAYQPAEELGRESLPARVGDALWIIDYKWSVGVQRRDEYREQLAGYRALVEQMLPRPGRSARKLSRTMPV
jgi:hypothetical protein